jgi:hypothetical protein
MNSKFYFKFYVILAIFSLLIIANDKLYSQEYNDDDYQVKNRRYGFGIGFNPFYIKHDFKDLNDALILSGNEKLSSNNIITLGGSFFTYIGFLPNLRIGGYWSSADKSSSNNSSIFNQSFDYKYSFWGISCDYAYPAAKRLSIIGGVMLGKGSQEYDISYKYNKSTTWDEIWRPSGGIMAYDHITSLSSSFFLYSPYVMFEYAVWDFLALRAGGGYMGSVKTDLNYENFYSVSSAPSSLRINNFYFQFGILAGLFMD